jgi:hypothetical protein
MDENRECDADCKDDVKEERLLLLSENLWCGDLGFRRVNHRSECSVVVSLVLAYSYSRRC